MKNRTLREFAITSLTICITMSLICLICVAMFGEWQKWPIIFAPEIAMFGMLAVVLLVAAVETLSAWIVDFGRRK